MDWCILDLSVFIYACVCMRMYEGVGTCVCQEEYVMCGFVHDCVHILDVELYCCACDVCEIVGSQRKEHLQVRASSLS